MTCAVDCGGNTDYVLDDSRGDEGNFGGSTQPTNYETWNARRLADYVSSVGLERYAPMIITHKITGKVAPLLSDADLKEMGMTVVGDRLRFKQLMLQLGRRGRVIAREKPIWRGEEQRYFSTFEKELCTCFGCFPDDPTTYKLIENSLKIKRVDPAKFGAVRCFCCYEYSMKNIDLVRVKDIEVINVAAPCPQRVCCCANGKDLVELHPVDSQYAKLVLRVPTGEGENLSRLIMKQVEKNQIMDRD